MKHTLVCRIKPYIQPFERKLALAELATLASAEPSPKTALVLDPIDFEVASDVPASLLADRLAYWECVSDDEEWVTTQVRREATLNVVRNGISLDQIATLVPFRQNVPMSNRRSLRYGTHGIHEYRGRFFPQLVRALINIAGLPEGSVVADPMVGSGTTVVEAVLTGCHGLGIDMNPLSVLMARTKCELLSVGPDEVARIYQGVRGQLLERSGREQPASLPYMSSLAGADQSYLRAWFSEQVLCDLDRIATVVGSVGNRAVRDALWISLSNILRRVSWQDEEDLRVRRDVAMDADIDPVRDFLEEAGRSVRTVLAFLYENATSILGTFDVRNGDARAASEHWSQWRSRVDAIITSPPYATALPYLDTDRLSLCYLGLLTRPEHRRRDQMMIGNREITEKVRLTYLDVLQSKRDELPVSVVSLIETVDHLNSEALVGFRRRNLPALLTKYFLDMQQVFDEMFQVLKPGGPAYVVIGNNHTIAGGQRMDIQTPDLLVDMAVSRGFESLEHIPMEMLVPRGIFKRNAVASEVILSFRRPL